MKRALLIFVGIGALLLAVGVGVYVVRSRITTNAPPPPTTRDMMPAMPATIQ